MHDLLEPSAVIAAKASRDALVTPLYYCKLSLVIVIFAAK
jgi:hypothetical protein